ncbi:MAG: hypothetical protein N3B21_19225 [Clostridia bacterium]|nr:hypothetical protein [Clostridia bacterium]
MANLKQLIKDTRSLEEQIDGLMKLLQASKKKIQEEFDKQDLKEFVVEPEGPNNKKRTGVTLIAKKVERVTINYLLDKLQAKLDKEIFNEIVNKTYMINDMNGLIELLKKAGVSPGEFKKFIDVSTSVNKDAIKQLYSVGDIKKSDLEGCYEATIVKSISIKERKGDTD